MSHPESSPPDSSLEDSALEDRVYKHSLRGWWNTGCLWAKRTSPRVSDNVPPTSGGREAHRWATARHRRRYMAMKSLHALAGGGCVCLRRSLHVCVCGIITTCIASNMDEGHSDTATHICRGRHPSPHSSMCPANPVLIYPSTPPSRIHSSAHRGGGGRAGDRGAVTQPGLRGRAR